MKKHFLLLLLLISSTSYAHVIYDLAEAKIKCKALQLNNSTPLDEIESNCQDVRVKHVRHIISGHSWGNVTANGQNMTQQAQPPIQKVIIRIVKFYDNSGDFIKCYYEHDILSYCKVSHES